jgi:hypothetical protein
MTTTTHRTTAPRHHVGQIWALPTVGRSPVTITDVLPAGAIAFMHVNDGRRERLPADEFARRYTRLLAEPRHEALAPPDAGPVAQEVPDDF